MGWMILGLAIAAAVLALVLRQVRDLHARDTALIGRVRTSAMYTRLYPLLEKCDEFCMEQVLIRSEEVRITLYKPMNRTIRFVFEEQGLDPVDQPQTLRALAQAVALDVDCLNDRSKYFFVARSAPRDVGKPDRWYEYNVQPDYKDRMLRAWYDQREPEEGVIRE